MRAVDILHLAGTGDQVMSAFVLTRRVVGDSKRMSVIGT
jgi:hypothetical protein